MEGAIVSRAMSSVDKIDALSQTRSPILEIATQSVDWRVNQVFSSKFGMPGPLTIPA